MDQDGSGGSAALDRNGNGVGRPKKVTVRFDQPSADTLERTGDELNLSVTSMMQAMAESLGAHFEDNDYQEPSEWDAPRALKEEFQRMYERAREIHEERLERARSARDGHQDGQGS